MRTRVLAVFVTVFFGWHPVFATSARTIHPELVGFREVALNFSPQTVPGLDTEALEQQIRERIRSAGLGIDDTAPTILFVQIKYQRLPACPDFLLIETHIAVSENADVKRAGRTETVYVDTFKEEETFIEPVGKAAEIASTSTLGLIEYLLDASEYTASVMAKGK